MSRLKNKLYKTGIIAFTVCWVVFILIMTAQFFYLYSDELLGKKIPAVRILYMLLVMAGTVLHYTAALATLFAAAVYYRYLFRNYKISLNRVLIKSWPIPVSLFMFFFLYSSFVLPGFNMRTLVSLYELRQTQPGQEVEHVDRELFKNIEQTMTITAQISYLQELNDDKRRRQENFIEVASTVRDSEDKYNLLSDSVLASIGITHAQVECKAINTDLLRNINSFLEVYISEIWRVSSKIEFCRMYIVTNFKWPIFTVFAFYIGLFLGALSRRIHILVLILGLNWGISGLVFIPGIYLESLFFSNDMGAYASILLPFIYQALLVIVFYRISSQSLKQWDRKPTLIPHLRVQK